MCVDVAILIRSMESMKGRCKTYQLDRKKLIFYKREIGIYVGDINLFRITLVTVLSGCYRVIFAFK